MAKALGKLFLEASAEAPAKNQRVSFQVCGSILRLVGDRAAAVTKLGSSKLQVFKSWFKYLIVGAEARALQNLLGCEA